MIGLAIDRFPADSLRRVLDAPIEQWGPGNPRAGKSCVFGWGCEDPESPSAWSVFMHCVGRCPDGFKRFDRLCQRFGVPRTVRACKLRALNALEGSLQEFTGLPRREMRPTTQVSSAPKAKVQRKRPGRAHAHGTACACDEPQ